MFAIHTASTTVTMTLPDTYGWVIIAGAVLALELVLIGFCCAFRARFKYFNHEFLDKNFGDMHKEETGHTVPLSGYPDTGSGRYSQALSYKDWYELNNAQRVHLNFVEFAPAIFLTLFLAGIYYPVTAAILGAIIIVARLVYTIGYMCGGPNWRIFGALFNHLGLFALIYFSIAGGCHFINGVKP